MHSNKSKAVIGFHCHQLIGSGWSILKKGLGNIKHGHLHSRLNWARLQEKGKSPHFIPQLLRKSTFLPWTLKPGKPPPWTFKTVCFTSLTGYKRFSKTVLSFSFLFISAKTLKNHNKSQKIIKWKIYFFLDSTWVYLHN